MLQEDSNALQESAFRETYNRYSPRMENTTTLSILGRTGWSSPHRFPPPSRLFYCRPVPFQDTTISLDAKPAILLNKHQALGWVNVLGNILIYFRKGIEGFKRDQNKESLQRLVEAQKDLVAYLLRESSGLDDICTTLLYQPLSCSCALPKPVLWMNKTADSTYLPDLGQNGPIFSFYESSVFSWSRQGRG